MLAGITKETPDPPGGVIERDAQGEPTGYLMDTAVDLIKEVMPPVDRQYVYQALKLSVQDLLTHGITGGHTEDMNYYNGFDETLDVFQSLIHKEGFRFRMNFLIHHEQIDAMKRSGYAPGKLTDYLEIGSMKIFADGALGEGQQDSQNHIQMILKIMVSLCTPKMHLKHLFKKRENTTCQ